MRTIYYKEAPEKFDSIASLLIDYLGKNSPETYWVHSDELQCDKCRNRSLDDLILLCNNYFPETGIKELLRAVIEANKILEERNQCIPLYTCGEIQRPILHKSIYSGRNHSKIPVNSYASSQETRNSEFDIQLITSIANEIYAEI